MPIKCLILPPHFIAPVSQHSTNKSFAVLFVNLGSPAKPTAWEIAKFLYAFLIDLRVVELPKLFWAILLASIVLPIRISKNINKYKSVWMGELSTNANGQSYAAFNSPLHEYSRRFLKAIQGEINLPAEQVALAMRYGAPSIRKTLMQLYQTGAQTILVVPLYPQYASSTTGTVFTAVYRAIDDFRLLPRIISFGDQYFAFPKDNYYIESLVAAWKKSFVIEGKPEKLVLSFHGLPTAMIENGDVYQNHCLQTAAALTSAMNEINVAVVVAYQSSFGRQTWLSPSTENTMKQLAENGIKNIAVACPGFTVDCLETLKEVNQELRQVFIEAGGESYNYLPCLNDDKMWVEGMAGAINRQLAAVDNFDKGE